MGIVQKWLLKTAAKAAIKGGKALHKEHKRAQEAKKSDSLANWLPPKSGA